MKKEMIFTIFTAFAAAAAAPAYAENISRSDISSEDEVGDGSSSRESTGSPSNKGVNKREPSDSSGYFDPRAQLKNPSMDKRGIDRNPSRPGSSNTLSDRARGKDTSGTSSATTESTLETPDSPRDQ